jgi:hypothetical protein
MSVHALTTTPSETWPRRSDSTPFPDVIEMASGTFAGSVEQRNQPSLG